MVVIWFLFRRSMEPKSLTTDLPGFPSQKSIFELQVSILCSDWNWINVLSPGTVGDVVYCLFQKHSKGKLLRNRTRGTIQTPRINRISLRHNDNTVRLAVTINERGIIIIICKGEFATGFKTKAKFTMVA